MRKLLSLFIITSLTLGLLSGCGSSNKSSTEKLLKDGVLKVGVEGTYPPYTYHDEAGELTGFDVEVAKAIGEKLGVEVQFTESDWDSLLASIDSGRLDTVINAVSITDERSEKYDFAGPYFYITQQIVIKEGNTEIKSFEDLTGKKVATNLTNAYVPLYEEIGAEIVPIDTLEEAANLVTTGRADFADLNSTIFNEYLAAHPESDLVAAFPIPDNVDRFGIPIQKGRTELATAIQKAVEELLADGTIGKLSTKYFGEDFTKDPEK